MRARGKRERERERERESRDTGGVGAGIREGRGVGRPGGRRAAAGAAACAPPAPRLPAPFTPVSPASRFHPRREYAPRLGIRACRSDATSRCSSSIPLAAACPPYTPSQPRLLHTTRVAGYVSGRY
eukprot:2689065-Rhodomonas_salina.1